MNNVVSPKRHEPRLAAAFYLETIYINRPAGAPGAPPVQLEAVG